MVERVCWMLGETRGAICIDLSLLELGMVEGGGSAIMKHAIA